MLALLRIPSVIRPGSPVSSSETDFGLLESGSLKQTKYFKIFVEVK